jgi:succinate dehydrogenase hydrophobic anchor subunit
MAPSTRQAGLRSSETQPDGGGSLAWVFQVVSGGLLFLLLGVHIVMQHFVAKGGVRDYAQVLSYLANPVVVAVECLFVIVLVWHAMLGLRAVLLDFGFSHRGQALITRGIVLLGAVTAAYSFWLIATLAAKG